MVTLAAEAVCVSLAGARVLDNVSAAFAPGTVTGVIGPNGAGKSTLARVLAGLLRPVAGRATAGGRDLRALSPRERAGRIAFLPQGQSVHWPIAVERLVALGRLPHLAPLSRVVAADHTAIEAALAETNTAALRHRIVTDLSGGERARVLLARALATGAGALIADEPLAALDPAHRLEVMALLSAKAREGATVVVVLHDLTLAARACDRLVLLDRGRVAGAGTPAKVLTDAALAAVYGIAAWRGTAGGAPLLVPLTRLDGA